MEVYCFIERVDLELGEGSKTSVGKKISYLVPNKFLIETYEGDKDLSLSTNGSYIDDFSSKHLQNSKQKYELIRQKKALVLDVPLAEARIARRFIRFVDWSANHDNKLPSTGKVEEIVFGFRNHLDSLLEKILADNP